MEIFSGLFKKKITQDEKIFFIQHLALMLKAGISIPRSLTILAEQAENKEWKDVLEDLKSSVMKGTALEKALQNHKKVFPTSFVSVVKVGELKGDLSSVLETYAGLVQREKFIKEKVKSALTYPIFVLSAMVVLGIFAITYIFPKIVSMFEELEGDLPMSTKIVIGFSNFLTTNAIALVVISIVVIIGFVSFIKTKKGMYFFHKVTLKAPVVSNIVKTYNLARVTQNLGVLLKAGIPITEALLATSEILGNVYYKQSLITANEEINKGNFVNTAFKQFPNLYPNVVIQIINVGEESGVLDEMLERISDFYEQKLALILDSLASILEPFLILVLGAGVAIMAMAIIMPIYNLTSLV